MVPRVGDAFCCEQGAGSVFRWKIGADFRGKWSVLGTNPVDRKLFVLHFNSVARKADNPLDQSCSVMAPLAQEAVKTGIRFGIWLEPEMVNPRSELFEKHPDWAIRQPKRELELQRNQLTLDLTRPEVQEFEWSIIKNTLSVPDISYAKWDCNRYLTQPGSSYLGADRQSHLWIDYVHEDDTNRKCRLLQEFIKLGFHKRNCVIAIYLKDVKSFRPGSYYLL